MDPVNEHGSPWHLDKRVPVALILALAAQTFGVVWWASTMASTVSDHGRRIIVMEAADTRQSLEAQRVSEQIARMDERVIAQTAILRRIEDSLGGRTPQR